MNIHFYKYHGAGNDFILLDNREGLYGNLTVEQVNFLCDRHFGIGADGLMLLNNHPELNFEMKYFNADGREGSMCGNGGRCLTAFAKRLSIVGEKADFIASDGKHEAVFMDNGWIRLKMQDVNKVERTADSAILNTGSPHFVKYTDRVEDIPVVEEGRKIRYSERFAKEGINVNFVEFAKEGLKVRTYERGVEDETLACGTGVTAAAIAIAGNKNQSYVVPVRAKGGNLEVRYDKIDDQHFENIWLCGPVAFVFEGEVEVS